MNESEFRQEVVKRAPLLEALADEPQGMRSLEQQVSMSRSTIHRALGTFEEENVVRKADQEYGLTGFGQVVAERSQEFAAELETARALDEFLNAVQDVDVAVPLEWFQDAEVIRPKPREAHTGVKRIIELIEASDSLRMFSNVLSPLYVDVARREMVDGMDLEVVFDERLVDLILSDYVDEAVQAFRTGRFDVHVGSDVPFELFITDDSMAMAAHNDASFPRMFVASDSRGAIEWAEGLYRSYRDRARWFDPATLAPPADPEAAPLVED